MYKVCIITSWFPSSKLPSKGSFVHQFCKDLVYSGLNVSVITVLAENEVSSTVKENLKIYRVSSKFPLPSMLRIISNESPDLIHVHAPNFFSSFSIIIGKLKGIPVIATVHRAEVDTTSKLMSKFRSIILPRFLLIVAVSEFTKSLAIRAGADKSKIKVIYNSCNDMLFKPRSKSLARTQIHFPGNKKLILFVGNFVEIKGIFVLLESIKELRKEFVFETLLIGNGEEKEKLETAIRDSNLSEFIKLVDWQTPEKLCYFYNAADVFVLPSYIEGNSIALLEAMSSGLPIVTTNSGGNSECILNNENGFLVPSGDSRILARKIKEILLNEDLAQSFSQKSIEMYANKFSKSKQMEEYLKLYKLILSSE